MWPRPLSINAAFRSSMERRAASGILSLLHTRINEGKSSVMSESPMPFSWSPKKMFPHLSLAKEIKMVFPNESQAIGNSSWDIHDAITSRFH